MRRALGALTAALVVVVVHLPGQAHAATATPTGFSLKTATSTSLTFTWTKVPGAVNYRLYHGTNANGSGATKLEVGDVAQATISGLKADTTYHVDIASMGPDGQRSVYTPRLVAKTSPSGTSPVTPDGFALKTATPTSLTFTWTKVPGAVKYRLYHGTNANGSGATKLEVGDLGQATISGLKASTTYHVDVAALAPNGSRSEYTVKLAAATTAAGSSPPTPTGLTVSPGATSAVASWTKSPGAVKYRLYYGTDPNGGGAKKIEVGDMSQTPIPHLEPNRTYHVDIAALSASGHRSDYTAKLAFTTTSVAPGLRDDYPTSLRTPAEGAVIDPWRFYNRECTSFVAWRLNATNGIGFTNFMAGPNGKAGQFGNATNWGVNAAAIGFKVDMVPAVGSVAWWKSGHVAWVAKVNGNGTVVIEEYTSGAYATRTVQASSVSGFIHIADLP